VNCPSCNDPKSRVKQSYAMGQVVTRWRLCECGCEWQTEELVRHVRVGAGPDRSLPVHTGTDPSVPIHTGTDRSSLLSGSDLGSKISDPEKKTDPEEESSELHRSVPVKNAEPPVFTFKIVGKDGTWGIGPTAVRKYQEAFPDLNVHAEFRQAVLWCENNAGQRKTPQGMPRFLQRWLGRAQDSGRGKRTNGSNGGGFF